MAQENENCRTAKDLLAHVNHELAWFDAKKLPDLKKELEDFVKAQDGLVTEYKSKFPDLRKKWCARQVDVDRLCAHIKCEFPLKEEKWRKLVEECICEPLHRICCLKHRIAKRKRCCGGPLERKRNAAQAAYDKAKAHLDWMKTLATSLDHTLDDNSKLITAIGGLAPEDRCSALYLFYKLRRSHMHMAPFDASADCKQVCSEFDPENLCCEVFKRPCHDDDGDCVPRHEREGDEEHHHESCVEHLDAAWLMSPDKYRNALDCAWDEYHKSKNALAEAEAALKKHPDDLDSLIKKLEADKGGIDDTITKCLKAKCKIPSDDCCKEHEPKKGGC